MAAPRRSVPPIYVLNGNVDLEPLTGEPGQGWTRLDCASKKAYGCGKHGQEAVEGLTLYVRLGDAPLVTSSLAIRISDEARQRFESETEPADELDGECPGEMYASGRILMAEPDLIAIAISFHRLIRGNDLYYILAYNNVDASLSMINHLPDLYYDIGALQIVPSRIGGACELLLMARELAPGEPPLLCVFSPATATWEKNPACPWQIKGRRFPSADIEESFMATLAFSFQGKGFWADLAQGLVYCDLHSNTSHCDSVCFDFIGLPPGCKLDEDETLRLLDEPPNQYRIMGCRGDSVWFVCINRATKCEDDLVTMWTLHLPCKQWKEEWKFSARELWEFDGFKEAGLPKAAPEFPVLTADGDMCFVLTDQSSFEDGDVLGHICSIDVPNKRVLWNGQVHNYHFCKPVGLPSSFFQRKHGSNKRKLGD